MLPRVIDRRILDSRGGAPGRWRRGTCAIEVRSRDGSTRFVDIVGIPSPKDGSPPSNSSSATGSHESPANGDAHRAALMAWMGMHPSVPWNAKADCRSCRPEQLGYDHGDD